MVGKRQPHAISVRRDGWADAALSVTSTRANAASTPQHPLS